MIRLPAEWEEQEAILVVFPHKKSDWKPYLKEIQKSYIEFIKAISLFQKCIVLYGEKKDKKLIPKHKNIKPLHVKTDDTWIRDFGGIDVYMGDNLVTYDFIFNAWGDKFKANLDDKVTSKLYKKGCLKGKLIKKDFILEGGSIDTNGKNTLLTTSSCIYNKNRNHTLTKKQIKEKICNFFGIDEFICLKNGFIYGDDTDSHIDILARFIDKKTIAYVTCKDKKDIHYKSLKAMEKEFKKTRFNLLPIPLPKPIFYKKRRLGATYLNFIFLNKALIVPTYNQPLDKKVLKILKKALPSLHVKGVNGEVFLRQNGSLHCGSINRFLGKR